MFFAESMPTAPTSSIGMAVVVGSLLLSALSAVLTMFLTRREHVAHKEEVDRRLGIIETQFKTLQEENAVIREEIHKAERRLADAGEHRAEAIHTRFNTVLERLSEVRGEMNAANRKT